MKIHMPMRRPAFLLCVVLVSMVVLFPLRLAFGMAGLDSQGFAARDMRGSIWSGKVDQLSIAAVPVGTVRAHLSPLNLLLGRARMDLSRRTGGPDDLKGAVSLSATTMGLDDATASLATGRLLAPLPISGVDLTEVSVRFGAGGCEEAQGRVRARMTASYPGLSLAQGLSGNAACDGRALLLPLVSQSGMEKLTVHIQPEGEYRAELLVKTGDAELIKTLMGSGFAASGEGYLLKIGGAL